MATRHQVRIHSAQQARIILSDLAHELGTVNEIFTHSLVAAVLKALRRHLTPSCSALLRSRLPPYLLKLYADGWKPLLVKTEPSTQLSKEVFLREVYATAGTKTPRGMDLEELVKGTLKYVTSFLRVSDSRKIRESLPEAIQVLWPAW